VTLKFGSHTSASGGVHKAITRAGELGITSCQLFSKNERQWIAKPLDPAVVEQFHAEVERTGIHDLVIHDSYLINLASPKEDILAKSIAAFQDELERSDLLGVQHLVTHPGAHTGSGVEAGIAQFAESLNRIFDTIPDNKTITCLETTAGQGTTLGRTFEELAAIIELVEAKDRVGICMDTCHIFAAGYELRTPEGYADTMNQFANLIGFDKLKVVHLNDSKNPLGSFKDRHDHIGDGELGLEPFRNIVNDPRFEGLSGILETEKDDANVYDLRNLATLNSLLA
jgi:deoxyribonuclease-4